MYQNILIPLDIDHIDHVGDIFDIADKLLNDDGSITLMHVIEDLPAYVAIEMPHDLIKKQGFDIHDKLVQLTETAEINASVKVLKGNPSAAILEYAEDGDIDLIIMASHRPELMDYFLGSTAAKVVRHAKCAVHVIR